MPRQRRGDEARGRPCQHDAEHQSGRDIADDAAANGLRREMGGIGNDDLHRDRAEPDEQRRNQERQRVGRKPGRDQRRRAERDDRADQCAVLDEIAERHDEQQPRAVADLRHGHDEASGRMRQAERGADWGDQGLGVIDVGGDHATGRGKHEGQSL